MTATSLAGCALLAAVIPVAASALGVPPSTAPPGQRPDITSGQGLVIGGEVGGQGGRLVPWGGTVSLTRRDANAPGAGTCAFNIAYDEINRDRVPTTMPFVNILRRGPIEVAKQTNRRLASGEAKRVYTQVYLASGPTAQTLSLTLDAENAVAETNESNNRFEITFVLREDCAPPTPPR